MKPGVIFLLACAGWASAATLLPQWQITNAPLANYFAAETRRLAGQCLAEIKTADDWKSRAPQYREQLAEMLGLHPLPARGDLKAAVTGRVEEDGFSVEKLHFQSLPGLYVTANFYLPRNAPHPLPAVLYVCGHGPVITNGISYGNKYAYHHHGVWFARNGYACLIIDTLQLGEIQGLHHGTHREGLWWWNARGYSPAGVETWNSMRALDYLSTRPEVDTNRFAITGRSGGGAYSWFAMAMDERIKAAAPVAGITDLENHVTDGATEGHCDCMFFVNTFRWDYSLLAALAAPRALLVCNTDSDYIFPLDGVVRVHAKVKHVYDLLGAKENLGLVITPGPHKDTQELQLPVMRWFNRHLKRDEAPVETAAVKRFAPEQLRVFQELPPDAINTNVHLTFVAKGEPALPKTQAEWRASRDAWLTFLRERSFAGWPQTSLVRQPAKRLPQSNGTEWQRVELPAESGAAPVLEIARPSKAKPKAVVLHVISSIPSGDELAGDLKDGTVAARLHVRGADLRAWATDARKQTQIRRRFMLLGQTLDSMRVWDIRVAIQAIRAIPETRNVPLRIEAEGPMAVNALYAALFEPVDELVLTRLPRSHMQGPDYLNVLRVMDVPQAVAMASEQSRIELRGAAPDDWRYPAAVARQFGWTDRLRFVDAASALR